jgi:predicted O-linked N-acetylglucosamine transferase (SPINDLY family)
MHAHREGRLGDAESGYLRALELAPGHADVLHMLAVLHGQLGRHEQAEAHFRAALEHSGQELHWRNFGKFLADRGRLDEAESAYRQALRIAPSSPKSMHALAALLRARGRPAQAVPLLRALAERAPASADAYNELGAALQGAGDVAGAEQAFRHAIGLDPAMGLAWYNLGIALHAMARLDETVTALERAATLLPNLSEPWNNLGQALFELDRNRQAETCFRHAQSLDARNWSAWANLGGLLLAERRFDEAVDVCRGALELDPGNAHMLASLLHALGQTCQWRDYDALLARLLAAIARDPRGIHSPFPLLALPGIDAPTQHRIALGCAQARLGAALSQTPLVFPTTRYAHGRPRIGYLSADFHDHATMYLLGAALEGHGTGGFDVYLYSYGPDARDASRARAVAACTRFIDLRAMSDGDAAARIAADEVDILVDLKGHTKDARLGITARRPAPVIVSWLGYPGTLGHERLADYLIGDPVVTPLTHAAFYSEALALMPHCYQPNEPIGPELPPPSRAEAGLPPDGFVFCSFNQAYKLTPAMFNLWCRILRAVPGSILWLLAAGDVAEANLRREAEARGVEARRLVFAPKQALSEHYRRLPLADLALDTYPYTSHTTGSDVLRMGVPLVTKIGDTFASRVAASLLHAVGMPELVAESDDAYFTLARGLALDPARLGETRARLGRGRATSALFDTAGFTRDLERLYSAILGRPGAGEKIGFALRQE